jgi:hypothetical protein
VEYSASIFTALQACFQLVIFTGETDAVILGELEIKGTCKQQGKRTAFERPKGFQAAFVENFQRSPQYSEISNNGEECTGIQHAPWRLEMHTIPDLKTQRQTAIR